MKDEIKEILDDLLFITTLPNVSVKLSEKKLNQLKDYITNLQEENERLKKNQRYYKNGVFSLEYDKETMSDMIDDYKSRIDKAIEYIDNHTLFVSGSIVKSLLQGSEE
jgi:O-phosphoseryl-tRNA(Cys) synthetase